MQDLGRLPCCDLLVVGDHANRLTASGVIQHLGQDPHHRRWQFDWIGVSAARDNNRSPAVERISSSVSLSSLTLWCHDSSHTNDLP